MNIFKKIGKAFTQIFEAIIDWVLPQEEPTGIKGERSGSDHPVPVVYGTRKVPAIKIFKAITNDRGGSSNDTLHLICVFCEGEIEEITTLYLNGIELGFLSNKKSSYSYVEYKTGADNQTPCSLHTDYNGTDVGGNNPTQVNWPSTATLDGLAYAYIRLKQNKAADVWRGEPQVEAMIKGKKVLDFRTQLTAYSSNPVLALYDYLTNSRYGKGLKTERIDMDAFTAAADSADEVVTYDTRLPYYENGVKLYSQPITTSKPKFDCHVILDTSKTVMDNAKTLLAGMRAVIPPLGGKTRVIIEDVGTPVLDFNPDNIIGNIKTSIGSKRGRYNRVTVRFAERALDWEMSERTFPTPDDSALETQWLAEDNGELLEHSFTFNTITDPAEALQMAKIIAYRSRQDIKVELKALPNTIIAEVGDIVTVTNELRGWLAKPFRVQATTIATDNTMSFRLIEHQDSIYPWGTFTLDEDITDTNLPLPDDITAPTGVTFVADNSSPTTCGRVSWDEVDAGFIDKYLIRVYQGAVLLGSFETTLNFYDLPFFPNGSAYRVEVAASNSVYTTDFVATLDFTIANYNRITHAQIESSKGTSWTKSNAGAWSPSIATTNIVTATFYRGDAEIGKESVELSVADATGNITAIQGLEDHASVTWSALGTGSRNVSLSFNYNDGTYTHALTQSYSTIVDGTDGDTGPTGPNGERGSKTFFVDISGEIAPNDTQWTDAAADNGITTQGYTKVNRDVVTLFNETAGSEFAQSRTWDGAAWLLVGTVIDGDTIVHGTVRAAAIDTDDLFAQNISVTGFVQATEAGGARARMGGGNLLEAKDNQGSTVFSVDSSGNGFVNGQHLKPSSVTLNALAPEVIDQLGGYGSSSGGSGSTSSTGGTANTDSSFSTTATITVNAKTHKAGNAITIAVVGDGGIEYSTQTQTTPQATLTLKRGTTVLDTRTITGTLTQYGDGTAQEPATYSTSWATNYSVSEDPVDGDHVYTLEITAVSGGIGTASIALSTSETYVAGSSGVDAHTHPTSDIDGFEVNNYYGGDLNTLTLPGFYFAHTTATNKPANGTVLHQKYQEDNANYDTQLSLTHNTNDLHFRTKEAGVWKPWETVAKLTGASFTGPIDLSGNNIDGVERLRTNEVRAQDGQQLVLNAGESGDYATGQTGEYVYINAEQGIEVNTSPDNWTSGWAGRYTAYLLGNELRLSGIRFVQNGATAVNLVSNSTASCQMDFRTTGQIRHGSVYANSSNQIGFLSDNGVWAFRVDSTTELDALLPLNMNNNSMFNVGEVNIRSNDGYGIKFWESNVHKIYMSSQYGEPYGVTELSTNADYNMYFRMGGSTNTERGFVFWNGTASATASAQITGNGQIHARLSMRTHNNAAQAAPRWDTSFYVLQSQHWYGQDDTQTMYLGEAGNTINIRGKAQLKDRVESNVGLHGGYGNSNGTGSDWGANIWSMGSAYDGPQAGAGYTLGGYCVGWLRSLATEYNTNAGEGIYLKSQNVVRGGWGHLGFWTTGTITASGAAYITGATNANGGLVQDGHTVLNGTDTWLRTKGDTGWYSATYGGGIYMTDTSWVRTYNGKKFYVSNTETNAIMTAGGISAGGIIQGSDAIADSDRRLKHSIKELAPKDGLKLALALNPVTHEWKDPSRTGTHFGYVAQDVQETAPILVHDSGDRLGVNYPKVVPILNAAIKAQQETIEEQGIMIEKLNAQIVSLMGRLDKLEDR